LVSGSFDGCINVWDITSGKLTNSIKSHKLGVYSVSYTPNGHYLISGSADRNLKIFDSKTMI
jgi:WD40 repeat protein